MFRKTVYSFLTIVLWLGLSTHAQNIVWISETNADADSVYFDQGWIDLLESEGYTVDFRPGEWMTLDDDKLATLESADLIIASRNSNSGNYATDLTEVAQWNSVPTPLILMTVYWCRNNRWLWINDTNIEEYAPEAMMQVVDSAHPVFEGIKPVDGLVDVIDETVNEGQNSFILTNDIGNGMLIAQRDDNQAVWIAEWAPDVEFYDGSGQVPAEKRMLFLAGGGGGQEAGSFNLNDDGTKIFLNAVKYMTGGGFRLKAFDPKPDDGAFIADTWVSLSWAPGDFAASHDVYLGDDFDAVSNAAPDSDLFCGNQTATFLTVGFPGFPYPEGLVPGTTYYWRIDEVNAPPDATVFKGDVWSFSVPPKTAYSPNPADNAEAVDINVTLGWTPGYGAKLHTVYFGETFDEVNNATGGSAQVDATYTPGTLKMARTYYWRVDEFDIVETHKGDVWSFTTEGAVSNPNPAKGAVDVTQTPVLTWTPGLGETYEIFFGTDADALEKKASGNLGEESFEPGQLEWNTTYCWRVDEANSANADSPWIGPTWSFTTANFLIIDDMEGYNDLDPTDPLSNRIFNAWIDGYGDPTNGSLVGYDQPPFAEQTIVHSGNQSMPFFYDNTPGKSEATLTLTSNRDWTVNGVDTLTIWVRGSAGNAAEDLYVALNGNAVVNNDNPDAATITRWTEWNIDLQAFADQGVNLSSVNSITLGLSSVTGGAGTLYFDDIRLYPLAP
jgi:hypothetical protein